MNSRILIRVGLGIVIVGLIVAAAWRGGYLKNFSGPATSPEVSASPSPVAETPPTFTYAKAPSDWPVYSSASLGFKVPYPKDWVVASCGESCVAWALASSSQDLFSGVTVTDGLLADTLTQAKPYVVASASVTLNGIVWTRLSLRHPVTGEIFTSHFVQRGTKLVEFGISSVDPVLVKEYGQMLDSFVFTK
ncbi:MAG TPA: hypothetical protein VMU12_02755 [Candidatus Paceibacterota bacterium]|nr:hypothetical protein [Candidatus Paceibacterota bacterium]